MTTELTRFEEAAKHYRACRSEILDAGRSEWGVDPYEWECFSRVSPIESDLWREIRTVDAVFYPQFPIGPFFADFCNPVAGVVIECDGAAWHQDKAKDAKRQAFIEREGYTVYRITGRDCKDEAIASEFVRAIAQRHKLIRGATSWCVALDRASDRMVCATMDTLKNLNAAAVLEGASGLALVRDGYTEAEAMSMAKVHGLMIRKSTKAEAEAALRITGDLT